MSDLVERLRGPWSVGTRGPITTLMTEAADELSRLRAENERLEARRRELWEQRCDADERITELEEELDTATRALSDLRARIEMPDEATVDELARGIVSVWYGGFEDQTKDETGTWYPGRPNARARNLIRTVLGALSKDLTADKAGG